jgi:hypothetical protein
MADGPWQLPLGWERFVSPLYRRFPIAHKKWLKYRDTVYELWHSGDIQRIREVTNELFEILYSVIKQGEMEDYPGYWWLLSVKEGYSEDAMQQL